MDELDCCNLGAHVDEALSVAFTVSDTCLPGVDCTFMASSVIILLKLLSTTRVLRSWMTSCHAR